MSPSTVEETRRSVMPRAAAMFARPEVRQAAMACSRNSTGVGPWFDPDEHGRVVGVVGERLRAGRVLLPGAVEALDDRAVVGAADPFVGRAELELGDLRRALHRVEGGEQRRDVDAVAGRSLKRCCGHDRNSVRWVDHDSDARRATFPAPSLRGSNSYRAHMKAAVRTHYGPQRWCA